MHVRFRTNLGMRDAASLGLNFRDCLYEAEMEVDDATGAELVRRNLADSLETSPSSPPAETVLHAVPPVDEVQSSDQGTTDRATGDLKEYRKRARREK